MLSATGLELCSLCPEILSYCALNSLSTQRPSCPTEKVLSVKRRRDAVVECAHMGRGTAEEPLSRDQKLLLASRASAINGGALSSGDCEDIYHTRAPATGLPPQASQRPSSGSPCFPLPGVPNKSFRDSACWDKPEAKLSNSGTKGQAGRTHSKGRINSQSLHESIGSASCACWRELKSNASKKYMEKSVLISQWYKWPELKKERGWNAQGTYCN